MSKPLVNIRSPEPLPPAARRALAAGMAVAHLAAGWAMLQLAPVRQAVHEIAPILVDLIAAPAPSQPAPPPSPPPPPLRTPPKPPSRALVVSAPSPAPEPPVFVAPPPSVEPPAPEPARTTVVATPAPTASTAPAATPQAPKLLAITRVEYLTAPQLAYPPAARRMQEQGQVNVRVLVDVQGAPQQTAVIRSSGYPRLDEAALAAVRATRFKPYTENGQPLPFWVVMPLLFELEN